MILTKNGITVEIFHPTDIARYKRSGFTEVEKEAEKPVKKSGKKENLQPSEEGGE